MRGIFQRVLSMCRCFSVAFRWVSLLFFGGVRLLAYSGKKSVQLLYMSQPTFFPFFSGSPVVAFSFQNSVIRLNNCAITLRNINSSDEEEHFFLATERNFPQRSLCSLPFVLCTHVTVQVLKDSD